RNLLVMWRVSALELGSDRVRHVHRGSIPPLTHVREPVGDVPSQGVQQFRLLRSRAALPCTVVDLVADLEQRLANGEQVWHWLHDNPEWGEFTLLFISLHREGDYVVAGLWEVWDDGRRGEPSDV